MNTGTGQTAGTVVSDLEWQGFVCVNDAVLQGLEMPRQANLRDHFEAGHVGVTKSKKYTAGDLL